MEKLYLSTPKNFSFKSTLFSHGWSDLRPFKLIDKSLGLTYVIKTSQNNINLLKISEVKDQKLKIIIDGHLNDQDKTIILKVIERMFRLDEDYTEFYKIADKSKEFSWI